MLSTYTRFTSRLCSFNSFLIGCVSGLLVLLETHRAAFNSFLIGCALDANVELAALRISFNSFLIGCDVVDGAQVDEDSDLSIPS